MAYIPKFNKLSLQEMAYAPQLMRQQHDEAVARNMEIAEALQFDYLNQDAEILEPRLQQYSQEIEDVSKDLSGSGFSHGLKNKILDLRTRYGSDEQIRNVKKNYAQAMSGWEEAKKSLIQKGASGDQINKMKQAYFGDYKGAYDDEGFYSEFTPGATSGVYDIAEDTKKAMSTLGKTGRIVGKEGSGIEMVPADPTTGIPAHYRVTTSTPGQYITTENQVDAVAEYMKQQYDPSNKMSDKGLYSKIMGLDKGYIDSIIDQVGTSMGAGYYQSLPRETARIAGLSGGNTTPTPQIAQTGYIAMPRFGPKGSEQRTETRQAEILKKAKEAGLPVKSYQDVVAISSKKSYEGVTPGMGMIQSGIGRTTDDAKIASEIMQSVDSDIMNNPGKDLPTWEISLLTKASGKSMTEAGKLNEGMSKSFKKHFDSFKGTTDLEQEAYEDISKNIDEIVEFTYDPDYGLGFIVMGENDEKEPIKSSVYLPKSEFNKERIFVNYLAQLQPNIITDYITRHNIESIKELKRHINPTIVDQYVKMYNLE